MYDASEGGYIGGGVGDCLDAVIPGECFAQYRQRAVKKEVLDALFPALLLPRDREITIITTA
jgi:hypothetical protein